MKEVGLLLLAAELATAAGRFQAKQHARALLGARDLTSWGGYALMTKNCPSGTTACGSNNCCPSSYKCMNGGSAAVCCPGSDDCTSKVKALQACADTSWGLFDYGGYFCCDSNSLGTYTFEANRQCLDKSLPISSIALSSVAQVTQDGTAAIPDPTKTNAASGTTQGPNGGSSSSSSSGSGSSSSGTGSVSRPPPSTTGSSGPASSNNVPTSSGSSSGLPQPAVIAIAVLSTAVVMLLIFIPLIFCWRKGRLPRLPPGNSAPPPAPAHAHQGLQELHHQHQQPPAVGYAQQHAVQAHHDVSPVGPPTYTTPPPHMSELHNSPYISAAPGTGVVQRNELAAQADKRTGHGI